MQLTIYHFYNRKRWNGATSPEDETGLGTISHIPGALKKHCLLCSPLSGAATCLLLLAADFAASCTHAIQVLVLPPLPDPFPAVPTSPFPPCSSSAPSADAHEGAALCFHARPTSAFNPPALCIHRPRPCALFPSAKNVLTYVLLLIQGKLH